MIKNTFILRVYETFVKIDPAIDNKANLRTHQRINILLTSLEKNNNNNFKTYIRNEKHF